MARIYRTGTGTRLVNLVFQVMARLGLGNGDRHVLSVRGRTTGKPHSTPVDVMEQGGRRWLVASYGVTNWVRNARVAGEVRITRGRRPQTLRIEEVGPKAASRCFGSTSGRCRSPARISTSLESSDEEFAAGAPRHPVFRLISPPG